ncbi:hypothetical protein [Rhodomicrobium lacus]|uniref:hypothetical protein n=1 Tax=Rhodomicrobium lacus TaxID=2498452 RepID=UPI000F8F1D74|nr:hypothetical protein [Rhodomicrobium lacus]
MSGSISIAGQPGGCPYESAQEPDGAGDTAIAAIEALNERMQARKLFGFLGPSLVSATYYDWPVHDTSSHGAAYYSRRAPLWISCDPSIAYGVPRVIEFEWAVLWRTDDWYEVGWHPSYGIHGLVGGWGDLIWDALNPGKRMAGQRRY